jgi:glycosyltransferase involved in cell wall biosynthesis
MRIGIDYTPAINQSAGIGRFVRSLVEAVAEIDHENDYILVHAAPNDGKTVSAPVGANISTKQLRFKERPLTILWHRLRVPLPVDFFTGPLDIFHAPNFVLPPIRRGVSIITVHDLGFLIHPECADEGLREFLEQAVPRSVADADYIIADSENTRNDVICLLDAKPDNVFVVPGGVDPSFKPEPADAVAEVREKYELDQPYLLAVGVIEPRKNLPRLIEAYTRFRVRTGLRHQLVIAGGKGWLWESTFAHAERSAFSSDIRFVGFVPEEHLSALYTGAELFAYPSLYEGFGLPVLEAMACGTPVVCSNSSSLPEFAGDAAILFPPEDSDALADALEAVCTDSATRDRLKARGLERADRYQWENSARRLIEIYEQVHQANAGRGA